MKKITCIITMILIFIISSNISYASETKSFGISLKSTKTQVNPSDEITITLRIKDFKNITEGIYSFLTTIQYDKNVFEKLTETSVKGLGTWSSVPTFNPENGMLLADSGSGVKTESDVFSITFKVKESPKIGNTEIIVKDFEASEGDEDLSANTDAKIVISVLEKQNDSNTGNNNSGSNDNNDKEYDNNNSDNGSTGDNKDDNNDNGSSKEDNKGDNNNDDSSTGNNKDDKEDNDSSTEDNKGDNNDDNSTGNNNDNKDENKEEDKNKGDNKGESIKDNSSTGKLPQTGEYDTIIFLSIGVITILAILGYFGYKKYNRI